ncbi:MAG TPA: hypothetical protein VGK35_11800, partial [Actinotalea sp.]
RTSIPARSLGLGALRLLTVLTFSAGAAAMVVAGLGAYPAPLQLAAAFMTTAAGYGLAAAVSSDVREDLAGVIHVIRLGIRRRVRT